MEQPPGFETSRAPKMVCKLIRPCMALNRHLEPGLRDCIALVSFGFKTAKPDQSLFFKVTLNCTIYILVQVDDILITRNE